LIIIYIYHLYVHFTVHIPYLDFFFFFNDPATPEIYTLSLHDALPIYNVFRKFSAFHDETGRLNVDGMNIISNDGNIQTACLIMEIGRAVQQECRDRSRMPSSA